MIVSTRGFVEQVSFHSVSHLAKANECQKLSDQLKLMTSVSATHLRIRMNDENEQNLRVLGHKRVYSVLALVQTHPDIAALQVGEEIIFQVDSHQRMILVDSILLRENTPKLRVGQST